MIARFCYLYKSSKSFTQENYHFNVLFNSTPCIAQSRRTFSSTESAKTEGPELTTDLEKKLHADVEALTTQNATLEEKNGELLVNKLHF